MRYRPAKHQRGFSLTSLIIMVIVFGATAVVGMKVFPTVSEYYSIKKAIVSAKNAGSTEQEIRTAFNRYANATYIDAIRGSDLIIERVDSTLEVSFSYEKRIPLVGPASLLLEYEGSTAKSFQKRTAR